MSERRHLRACLNSSGPERTPERTASICTDKTGGMGSNALSPAQKESQDGAYGFRSAPRINSSSWILFFSAPVVVPKVEGKLRASVVGFPAGCLLECLDGNRTRGHAYNHSTFTPQGRDSPLYNVDHLQPRRRG